MVQSINTRADLTMAATFYGSLPEYGQLMLGDRGFEFYAQRDVNRCMQIRWEAIRCIKAWTLFHGRRIVRFEVMTHDGQAFAFAAKDAKAVLRQAAEHVPSEKMIHARSLFTGK